MSRLQKRCQELQRHLEKACRQLQHTVRENKAGTQRLKGTAPAGGAPEPLTLLHTGYWQICLGQLLNPWVFFAC